MWRGDVGRIDFEGIVDQVDQRGKVRAGHERRGVLAKVPDAKTRKSERVASWVVDRPKSNSLAEKIRKRQENLKERVWRRGWVASHERFFTEVFRSHEGVQSFDDLRSPLSGRVVQARVQGVDVTLK